MQDLEGIVVGREDKVPVGDLIPWPENPRENDHAVPDIMESFRLFGVVAPIIVRRSDNMICGGHTRHKAATMMGMATVPVVWIECEDRVFKKAALALNRLSEVADWKEDELAAILRDLRDEGDDLLGLGWGADDLATIIGVGPNPYLEGTAGNALDGLTGGSSDPLQGLDPGADAPKPRAKTHKLVFATDAERAEFFTLLKAAKDTVYPNEGTDTQLVLTMMRECLEGV